MDYSRVRLLLLAFITSVRQGSCECEDKLCISASYFSSEKVNILCTSNYTIDPNFEVQEHGNDYFVILSTSVLIQEVDYTISKINDSFFSLNVSNAVHHNGSLYRCFSHVGRDSAASPLLQLVVAGEVNIPTSSSVSSTQAGEVNIPTNSSVSSTQGFTSVPVTNMATTPNPSTENNFSDSASVPVVESVVVPVIIIILAFAVAVIVVIFVIKCTRYHKISSITKNQNLQEMNDGPISQLQSDAHINSNGTDYMDPTDDTVLDASPPINYLLLEDNTSSHTLTVRQFQTREMELLPHSVQETEDHAGSTPIVGPQGIHLTRTRKETRTDSEESFRTLYVNEEAGIKMIRSPAYEPIRRNTPEYYVNDEVRIKMTRSPAYIAVERDIPKHVNDEERIKMTRSPAYVAVEQDIPEYVNNEARIKMTRSPAYVPIEHITPKSSSSNSTDP